MVLALLTGRSMVSRQASPMGGDSKVSGVTANTEFVAHYARFRGYDGTG